MKSAYRNAVCFFLLMAASVMAGAGSVVSENLVFMKEDGRSHLLHRSMRTGQDKYNFYLNKTGKKEIYYVDPADHEWNMDHPESNVIKFASGSFAVMYPGDYDERVTVSDQGIYTLDTHDGLVREDGHFGSWNSPGNFNRFVQAWVFPEIFRIISYESNREGEWFERNNTLSFHAKDVNDLTFIVRYQLIDTDRDGVADANDRCPGTAPALTVDDTGCEPDSDHDGVLDRQDRCADTPEGVAVNEHGCEPDSDADGVVDRMDKCPESPAGFMVNRTGCEEDCDEDGVPNSRDSCPRTPVGTQVNEDGCELDTDGDGIADSLDKCPDTAPGRMVDANGCELDADGDGVVDSLDKCLDTAPGRTVDANGCELDADGDGVVDSLDKCPDTPPGRTVDANGCELDADGDGVVDSLDKCPDTAPGRTVDANGCELDADGDGVVDSLDKCPDTAPGRTVDANGCELDADGDGVVDSLDKCPDTTAGRTVDENGCELDADGDGVVDSLDKCPDTTAGRTVDENGCELDADGDGVLDAADLCPDTAPGVAVDVTGCDVKQPIELRGVNFHFNSDELTEDSKVILDGVAGTLLNHPGLTLEVAGHTDSAGDNAFNTDLSQRRAESVRDYLVSKGVATGSLTARGYGEDKPVASNEEADGRAANRRVELVRQDGE